MQIGRLVHRGPLSPAPVWGWRPWRRVGTGPLGAWSRHPDPAGLTKSGVSGVSASCARCLHGGRLLRECVISQTVALAAAWNGTAWKHQASAGVPQVQRAARAFGGLVPDQSLVLCCRPSRRLMPQGSRSTLAEVWDGSNLEPEDNTEPGGSSQRKHLGRRVVLCCRLVHRGRL